MHDESLRYHTIRQCLWILCKDSTDRVSFQAYSSVVLLLAASYAIFILWKQNTPPFQELDWLPLVRQTLVGLQRAS